MVSCSACCAHLCTLNRTGGRPPGRPPPPPPWRRCRTPAACHESVHAGRKILQQECTQRTLALPTVSNSKPPCTQRTAFSAPTMYVSVRTLHSRHHHCSPTPRAAPQSQLHQPHPALCSQLIAPHNTQPAAEPGKTDMSCAPAPRAVLQSPPHQPRPVLRRFCRCSQSTAPHTTTSRHREHALHLQAFGCAPARPLPHKPHTPSHLHHITDFTALYHQIQCLLPAALAHLHRVLSCKVHRASHVQCCGDVASPLPTQHNTHNMQHTTQNMHALQL